MTEIERSIKTADTQSCKYPYNTCSKRQATNFDTLWHNNIKYTFRIALPDNQSRFSKWPLHWAVTVWTEALVPSATDHNSLAGLQVANGPDFYRDICYGFNVQNAAHALHNNGRLYYFTPLSTGKIARLYHTIILPTIAAIGAIGATTVRNIYI